jgi:hypothetical protein
MIVRKKKEEFQVNKALICNPSEFFKVACIPEWVCGQKKYREVKGGGPGYFRDLS